MNQVMLRTDALAKSFTLHLQGGVRIPVLSGVGLERACGRVRCAVRAVGRRQVDADAQPVRQLSRRVAAAS